MKSIHVKVLAIVFSVFSMVSCIEIEEEVSFKDNGSGKYSVLVKMTQFKEMMALASSFQQDGAQTFDPFGEMKKGMEEQGKKMQSIKGISNFTSELDTTNVTITFKFDFANIAALNKALNQFDSKKEDDGAEPKTEKTFYSFSNKVLSVNSSSSLKDFELPADEDTTMAMAMLSKMKYTGTHKFESKVKSYTNKSYTLGKDGKSLSLSTMVSEVARKKLTLDQRVTLQ